MNTKVLLLPALCLGGAALLLAPARPSGAFSKIGGNLGETQRDVRVFDNFLDSTADNNAAFDTQFPGWNGLDLAIWKGVIEWGSQLHGDGTGDPLSGNLLGDGGANFDPFFAGAASGIGNTNHNIVSSIATCGGGGTLAYTETPISDGWRIRYCDEWTWDDGPSTIGSRWDIQGVMCHEYGHALGLGHSTTNGATMFPSGSPGQTSIRSIAPDDISGIKCVYGTAAGSKPSIVATVASGGNLTIFGSNFGATGNEVWFTNATVTLTGSDPIVRVTGVSSSGGNTAITVAIPVDASPGDVIVNAPGTGGATLSNAFPTDLVGTFGTPPGAHPDITSITPATLDALIPGTAKTVTITGTDLDLTTSLLLDGVAIAPSRYMIVDPNTIQLDMPQASSLGVHNIGASDGVVTDDFPVTIISPATPKYELGNGDLGNVVDRDNGLPFIVSGTPGRTHRLVSSPSNVPSVIPGVISLSIGNNFNNLITGGDFVIPAKGWLSVFVPTGLLIDPGPGGATFYSQTVDVTAGSPYPVSNLQSIMLVQ